MQKSSKNILQIKFNNALKVIHHDQVRFTLGMQRWFHTHILIKNKNHVIISIDTEKAFDKIQHQFMIKINSPESGHKVGIIMPIYDKPTANILLNGEKLKALPLIS